MHVQLHTYIDKGALSAGLNWRRKQKVWLVAEMQSWLKGSGGGAGSVTGARYFRTPSLQVSKSARLLTHRHLDNFLHPCLPLELHWNRKISQCDHARSWVWIHSTASKTVYLSTQSELTLFPNWRNRRPWKLCFLVQQRLLSKKSVLAGWLCICLVYSVGWLVV